MNDFENTYFVLYYLFCVAASSYRWECYQCDVSAERRERNSPQHTLHGIAVCFFATAILGYLIIIQGVHTKHGMLGKVAFSPAAAAAVDVVGVVAAAGAVPR